MSAVKLLAPATSRATLRKLAYRLRLMFELQEQPWFPIIEIIEIVLPNIVPGFEFDVRPRDELGHDHGLTLLNEQLLVLREDVCNRALLVDQVMANQ